MKIEIRGRGVDVTDALRERAERRAGFAFDRFGGAVVAAEFMISDSNGPRGGVDKTCTVVVRGRHGPSVRAAADSDDVDAAIAAATDRAARAFARQEDRRSRLLDRASAAEVADRGVGHPVRKPGTPADGSRR
ncbi:MAG: HPF/RaiA family ribosome-associated protein [Planctomycetes bacterium]|nr:HPF/RaiA family ribosome-associated protein [Planctomycetota bacterium]